MTQSTRNASVTDTTNVTDPTFGRIMDMIARWRRFIFFSVLISTVASTIIAFLITPKFKSTASVFPAEKADLFGAIEGVSSLVKSFAPRGLTSLTSIQELDRYIAILNSGRVLGEVIEKFDLVRVYEITEYPNEKTTKKLLENADFSIEPEDYLTITVYDEDPQRAADMANFFVDVLNRANSELQVQNARGNRRFVEERYKKNLLDLTAAEDSLKSFQKQYGIIAMSEQTEASIKAGAELAVQLATKEVQLGVLKRTQSRDHPMVVAAQIQIDELKRKMSEMNRGMNSPRGEMNLFVPFDQIPDLGSEFLRRYREVEIQSRILEFLTPLYEQAKVEERRQTPSVLVLDRAYPAERKSKPKRLLIMLGGMCLGLFGSIGYMGLSESWKREKERNSPIYRSTSNLLEGISSDLRSIVRQSKH